jgi:glutathione S-transferase
VPISFDVSGVDASRSIMVRGPIYHLALAEDWERDPASTYATSTLGRSLAEQGFVHCSFGQQVQQIADMVYRGRRDVLLLKIDPARLVAKVRVENLDGGRDLFPHIYGPVNRDAVVKITPVGMLEDGRLDVASIL